MNPYDSLLKRIDVELIFAIDVVKYSRYVQHSLTPLDLSIYSLRRRKLNIPRSRAALEKLPLQPRRILQTLNIDSPNHFKRRFENLKDTLCPDSSFLVASFGLSTDVYFKNFNWDIMKRIEKSSDPQGNVEKYMKVAQMIQLPTPSYVCFLQQVLEAGFKQKQSILDMNNAPFVDFILFHSLKIDFDPFVLDNGLESLTPLDYSLHQRKLRNIPSLIKYGYQFSSRGYCVLQFLDYIYQNEEDSKLAAECFLLYWNSIPDYFLVEGQLKPKSKWRGRTLEYWTQNTTFLDGLWSLYTKVLEQDPNFCPGRPRSLAHQCRCAIRTLLTRKRALPGGIEVLGLPMDLQAYLRLEH